MNKIYDYTVFIGRMQPPHLGHINIIDRALEHSEKVIVILGSANEPPNLYNPFSVDERIEMLTNVFGKHNDRIIYRSIEDVRYNDEEWATNIVSIVRDVVDNRPKNGFDRIDIQGVKISLIGHSKDQSSFYLKLFPQWGSTSVENYQGISSTPMRKKYFEDGSIPAQTPYEVQEFLRNYLRTEKYAQLRREQEFINKYRSKFDGLPWAPTFVTVDAVVIQSAHVLLVRRRAEPGKGLYALPGGFLNPNEKIVDGIIRELREETVIKVPEPVLRGSLVEINVFDNPHRSARGRTITHAGIIHLRRETSLPKVTGSDDADKAFWLPLSEVKRSDMFEDHKDIIDMSVKRLRTVGDRR